MLDSARQDDLPRLVDGLEPEPHRMRDSGRRMIIRCNAPAVLSRRQQPAPHESPCQLPVRLCLETLRERHSNGKGVPIASANRSGVLDGGKRTERGQLRQFFETANRTPNPSRPAPIPTHCHACLTTRNGFGCDYLRHAGCRSSCYASQSTSGRDPDRRSRTALWSRPLTFLRFDAQNDEFRPI